MLKVVDSFGSRVLDPRKLFAAAAVLGAITLAMGYVEYHDRADRDLALRQGPPPVVALQDFSPRRHTGPTDEISIRAEAGLEQALVLSLPGAEPPRRALVVPLYPLSEMGAAQIEARSEGTRTALTAQVARRTGDGAAVRPAAIGLIYHPLVPGEDAPDDPAALALKQYGNGEHGRVVTLNGRVGVPGELGLMAAGALAVNGRGLAAGYLPVQPFTEGREAALAARGNSRLYLAPAVLALVLALTGIVAGMRGYGWQADAAWEEDPAPDMPSAAVTPRAAHPKFAPIPTQEEIIEAARTRSPEEANWMLYYGAALLRGLWVGLRFVGRALGFCLRTLRNRLSRREDEVL